MAGLWDRILAGRGPSLREGEGHLNTRRMAAPAPGRARA